MDGGGVVVVVIADAVVAAGRGLAGRGRRLDRSASASSADSSLRRSAAARRGRPPKTSPATSPGVDGAERSAGGFGGAAGTETDALAAARSVDEDDDDDDDGFADATCDGGPRRRRPRRRATELASGLGAGAATIAQGMRDASARPRVAATSVAARRGIRRRELLVTRRERGRAVLSAFTETSRDNQCGGGRARPRSPHPRARAASRTPPRRRLPNARKPPLRHREASSHARGDEWRASTSSSLVVKSHYKLSDAASDIFIERHWDDDDDDARRVTTRHGG